MRPSHVVLLLIFLAGGAAALLLARREFSKETRDPAIRAQQQLGAIQMGLERFKIDTGSYPAESDGLSALMSRPYELPAGLWRGPYLESRGTDPLRDPWNRPYRYRTLENGRGMAFTLGADGRPGGEGEDRDLMGVSEVMRHTGPVDRRSGSAFEVLRGKPDSGENR